MFWASIESLPCHPNASYMCSVHCLVLVSLRGGVALDGGLFITLVVKDILDSVRKDLMWVEEEVKSRSSERALWGHFPKSLPLHDFPSAFKFPGLQSSGQKARTGINPPLFYTSISTAQGQKARGRKKARRLDHTQDQQWRDKIPLPHIWLLQGLIAGASAAALGCLGCREGSVKRWENPGKFHTCPEG